jgi:hypothetical protein
MDASPTPRDRADAQNASQPGKLRYQASLAAHGWMRDNGAPPPLPVLPLRFEDALYPGNLGGRLGVNSQKRTIGRWSQ